MAALHQDAAEVGPAPPDAHGDRAPQALAGAAALILGGEVTVPTLDGSVKLTVPPETQNGRRFRLRGKGIRNLRSQQTGDLFCHVTVEVPVRLSERQKTLIRELDNTLKDAKHSPQTRSWMDRVKTFFQ